MNKVRINQAGFFLPNNENEHLVLAFFPFFMLYYT